MTRDELKEGQMYRYIGDLKEDQGMWRLVNDDGTNMPYFRRANEPYSDSWCIDLSDLEPVTKSLYDIATLEVGDEVVGGDGNKRRILAICGELVALGYASEHQSFSGWFTQTQLKRIGFTLVTPAPSVTEVNGKKYDTDKLIERLKDLPEVDE